MSWARVIGPEPPDEAAMNHWEKQGWSQISVLGPCPTIDRKTGKPGGAVFVVYLHRSIVAVGEVKRPGWPVRAREKQPVTDSGEGRGDGEGGALN
jgi:hypothetical protein